MYIPKYIKQKNTCDENRRFLLAQSFFVEQLVRHIREQMIEVPMNGFENQEQLVLWKAKHLRGTYSRDKRKSGGRKIREYLADEYNISLKTMEPIKNQLNKFSYLNLDFAFIENLVLAGRDSFGFTLGDYSNIRLVTSKDDPIDEVGVYIKWIPNLSKEEISSHYEEATLIATKSNYKNILFPEASPKFQVEKNDRKRTELSEKDTKVYVEVEKMLSALYHQTPGDDVVNGLLVLALKRLSVKTGIRETAIKSIHYKLQKRYSLPSHREVKKIY